MYGQRSPARLPPGRYFPLMVVVVEQRGQRTPFEVEGHRSIVAQPLHVTSTVPFPLAAPDAGGAVYAGGGGAPPPPPPLGLAVEHMPHAALECALRNVHVAHFHSALEAPVECRGGGAERSEKPLPRPDAASSSAWRRRASASDSSSAAPPPEVGCCWRVMLG